MDIGWLKDFLTLADVGNFTKAAQKRNSSQAAFSRRVQSLEGWLGATLIDRSVFPVVLTPEGERFREHASDILGQMLDARLSISQGSVSRHDHISIALPHALATGRFATWWSNWSCGLALTCEVLPGNVGDAVNAMIAGAADILIYYHNPQQPLHLDSARYEQIVIGGEYLRPYAARHLVESGELCLPPNKGLPLLMYGADSYLARMVDLVIDSRPNKIKKIRSGVSNMSEVLREMAIAGYGVAWLPEAVLDETSRRKLAPVGDKGWAMSLSVMAYRDRANDKAAVHRLWSQIKEFGTEWSMEAGAIKPAAEPIRTIAPEKGRKDQSKNAA